MTTPSTEPVRGDDASAVLDRIAGRFSAISDQMSTVSTDLDELRRLVGQPVSTETAPTPTPPAGAAGAARPVSTPPVFTPPVSTPPVSTPPVSTRPAPPGAGPQVWPHPLQPFPAQQGPQASHQPPPAPPRQPVPTPYPVPGYGRPVTPGQQFGVTRPPAPSFSERVSVAAERGLIGKVLAAIGVGVTLIGVALLLVLAAQAGLLRPEFRVAGGGVLAAALVGGGVWLSRKPSGRTGAIALAATGIAAGYLDVLAATRIYGWLPIVAGLLVAAVVAAAGLALARRWDSQSLGLLVVIPLIVLAPILTRGLDITLIAFMIILAVATLWVQIGRDWIWLHIVRMAAPIIPLTFLPLAALVGASYDDVSWQFALAAGLVTVLGFGAALLLLRHSAFGSLLALVAAAATVPTMLAGAVLTSTQAAILQIATAALILALVTAGDRIAGVSDTIAQIWTAVALVLVLVAVVVYFDEDVIGPVLLGVAMIAAAGAHRPSRLATVCIIGSSVFWSLGMMWLLGHAAPVTLASRRDMADAASLTILIAAVLAVAAAVILAIVIVGTATTAANRRNLGQFAWSVTALVAAYAITVFTVTIGVLIDGNDGFFAGHVLATTCWVALGAATLVYARRRTGTERTAVITGGLVLIAAAMAKLFLFDLAALDGIFRVIVFIVVGLGLLGLGSWYARVLQESPNSPDQPPAGPMPPMPPH